MPTCPSCAEPIRHGVRFCTRCGAPQPATPEPAHHPALPDAVPDAEPDAEPTLVPDVVPDVVPNVVPSVVPDAVRGGATGGGAAPRRPPGAVLAVGLVVSVIAVVTFVVVGIRLSATDQRSGSDAGAGSTSAATSATSSRGEQQLRTVVALLTQSSQSRTSVAEAYGDVVNCTSLSLARSTFADAAVERDNLVNDLDALVVDEIPGGPPLVAALRAAWVASAEADRGYEQWAWEVTGRCVGTAPSTPGLELADAASVEATAWKNEFVRRWNAVAAQYGLGYWSSDEI